jgi:hypothetical protein
MPARTFQVLLYYLAPIIPVCRNPQGINSVNADAALETLRQGSRSS